MFTFSLPTKIIAGPNCIKENAKEIRSLGKKSFIVTGKNSASHNGSLFDVQAALEAENISAILFDQITSNPSINLVRKAAQTAREEKIDFIIGIGGGSPLDAAKAIAVLATNDLDDEALFSGPYAHPFLPVAAVPTTAGTGSEVTQYSILTNQHLETKTSIAHPGLFPKVAFLDARYTLNLPKLITIHTAIDALSHALEGYLSVKATDFSNLFAEKSLALLGECLPQLSADLAFRVREKLLYASMLAGVVIAHTGTTAVHSIGYSLTYFKEIDHGRANGLLLAEYLRFLAPSYNDKIQAILDLLQLKDISEFSDLMHRLLGKKEEITAAEVMQFSSKAAQAANLKNTLIKPTEQDIAALLQKSLTFLS
ncbi:alcohol dehydrogenase iron-type [Lucifera butyrica]|uniref:Alcohol dehydrogenase iron-type n=1 Tax=Lucifera butyrica TaxID=1351585 RepID=A0A498R7X1_9FIRM|nr:iron-containing alcohol dehydrogenase family protein [Lucifera butyrica]VBB07279.1 alcohol dehydrogenase iron-type [Lucifera butyrica]